MSTLNDDTRPCMPWLTVDETAARLRLSKRTVQNYISRGAIKTYRSSTGTVRIHIKDADAFLGFHDE